MELSAETTRLLEEIDNSGMSGPNKSAAVCRLMIPLLTTARDQEKDPAKRKALNGRLRTCRFLLRFATSRAGYTRCRGGRSD